jgi:hypothetical protein
MSSVVSSNIEQSLAGSLLEPARLSQTLLRSLKSWTTKFQPTQLLSETNYHASQFEPSRSQQPLE